MLKKTNLKGLDLLVRGDVCNLPFQDSSFDSVISVHVLHLIEDCDKALSELKRVAKEKLLSVLYLKSDFNVIDECIESLKNCGYILELPGTSERDIKEKMPPKREMKIQGFKEMNILRERIRLLEEKKHSFTAHAPPKTHECAIRYLKNKHADKLDMLINSEIEVVAWDIVDLPDSIST